MNLEIIESVIDLIEMGAVRSEDVVKNLRSAIKDTLKQSSTPPQRKPLTDEAIAQIAAQGHQRWFEFARAIEAAHGIKGEA